MEGHGRSFPDTTYIEISSKKSYAWVGVVLVPFLWTLDLDLGLGFGTWYWDLDLELSTWTWA